MNLPEWYPIAAGAAALYLFDSLIAFYGDEVLVEEDIRGALIPHIQSSWLWGGRFVYLPSPVSPARLLFLMPWDPSKHSQSRYRAAPLRSFRRAIRPLQWLSGLLAALLFVALPAVVFWFPRLEALALLAGSIYSLGIVGSIYVVRRRRVLGLSLKQAFGIVFDLVACPPFAVNVVRKVTLLRRFPRGARSLLSEKAPGIDLQKIDDTVRQRTRGQGNSSTCEPSNDSASDAALRGE